MYLTNKYTSYYNNIIDHARSRASTRLKAKTLLGYVEKHHVIPKSLGGSNLKENLVFLTAKEHFVCHHLLTKMVTGKAYHQMIKAVHCMTLKTRHHQRHKITARLFEQLRIKAATAMSVLTKGKTVSAETRKKQSNARKGKPTGRKGIPMSAEQKQKLSVAHTGKTINPATVAKILETRKNYRHSEATKQKISESNKGKIVIITEATKQKISSTLKGQPNHNKGKPAFNRGIPMSEEAKQHMRDGHKNREMLTCEHCNKTITKPNYSRWHSDNCKNK